MKESLLFSVLILVLVLLVPFYLFQGAVEIRWQDALGSLLSRSPENDLWAERVFWLVRLPRLVLAVICGSSLALGGVLIQGIFRNPLVEPGLIGVSSGAALFASIGIVFLEDFVSRVFVLQGFSFLGALSTSILVYFLSERGGRVSVLSLLLMGIGINSATGAILGLLHYLATDFQLRAIAFWGLGSLAGASWDLVLSILPFYLLLLGSLPFLVRGLNAFLLGEREALHLGLNTEKFKVGVILIVCLSIGAVVSVTGVIGFIGLVVPHISRILGRANHSFLLPASALLGAILLTFSDYLARILVSPGELPIGILTAGIGAPVFMYILSTRLKEEG